VISFFSFFPHNPPDFVDMCKTSCGKKKSFFEPGEKAPIFSPGPVDGFFQQLQPFPRFFHNVFPYGLLLRIFDPFLSHAERGNGGLS